MPCAPSSSAIAETTAERNSPGRSALYALAGLSAVSLALAGIFLTEHTSLAQEVYVVAFACWLSGSLLGALAERLRDDQTSLWPNPLMLFFAIVAATFTAHAMDGIPPTPAAFDPTRPDELPGLQTDFTPYYLVLLAATVLFISGYGRDSKRQTEAGVAVMLVYTSLAFEHLLRGAGTETEPAVGTLSTPMLWAPLLVLLVMWSIYPARPVRSWRWTPLGGPLIALLAAGLISTVFSYYVHASLLMWLRVAAFVALLLLVANTATGPRQIRLYWLALMAPLAGAAVAIIIKLWDVNWNMGPGFVLSLRYQISGVAGTNPAGLSLGIGILLVVGAMILDPRWRKWLSLLLVPLVPAFLATHSPSGLVALVLALAGLLVFRFGHKTWRAGPRRWVAVTGGAFAIALMLGLIAFVPNPYTGKVSGDVQDPTTGRSVRSLVWQLAYENIRENPITGVGMQNYYVRTQQVADFPSAGATRIAERRVLIEGTGEPWKLYVTSHPHNSYLAVVETMGLLGLAALAWLGLALASIGWRLFRRADGSFYWWTATLSLAGAGMGLAWNIVAEGEDVVIIAVPFFPLAGLALAALGLQQTEAEQVPSFWTRLMRPFELWWRHPVRGPATAVLSAMLFLILVARPVAADLLAAEGDDAAAVNNPRSLTMLKWATRLSPLSADYRTRLSNAYIRSNRFSEALNEQQTAMDLRRDFAPDHTRLGWMNWYNRQLPEAETAFERAVELDRWDATNADVHMALGLARAGLGQYEESLDAFAYGFSVSPSMIRDEAWVRARGATPPLTYADPAYLKPLDQRLPVDLLRNIFRRLDMGGRQQVLSESDEAKEYSIDAILEQMHADYETLITEDEERAYEVLETMGQIALNAKLPHDARGYYQELADAQPESDRAYYGLGLALNALGEKTAAARAFERVLAIGRDKGGLVAREPFSYLELGRIALEREEPDVEQARRFLQEANEAYRWSYLPGLYPSLALAEALAGDREAARAALDKELYLLGE